MNVLHKTPFDMWHSSMFTVYAVNNVRNRVVTSWENARRLHWIIRRETRHYCDVIWDIRTDHPFEVNGNVWWIIYMYVGDWGACNNMLYDEYLM